MSIIDYGEVSIPGIGCDTCEFSREALLFNALIFAVIACIPGGAGAWLVISGHRKLEKKAGIGEGLIGQVS